MELKKSVLVGNCSSTQIRRMFVAHYPAIFIQRTYLFLQKRLSCSIINQDAEYGEPRPPLDTGFTETCKVIAMLDIYQVNAKTIKILEH